MNAKQFLETNQDIAERIETAARERMFPDRNQKPQPAPKENAAKTPEVTDEAVKPPAPKVAAKTDATAEEGLF